MESRGNQTTESAFYWLVSSTYVKHVAKTRGSPLQDKNPQQVLIWMYVCGVCMKGVVVVGRRTDANRAQLTCLLPVVSKQSLNGGGCWCSGTKELTLPAPLPTLLLPLILPVFQSIRCHPNPLFVFPFVLGQGAELPDNGQAHWWLQEKGKRFTAVGGLAKGHAFIALGAAVIVLTFQQ